MNYNSSGKRNAYVEIKLLLNYSHRPYQKYYVSNKKFIYASVVRKANARLLDRIMHFNDYCRANALKLMPYLEVWITIWDNKYEEKNRSYGTLFPLKSLLTFPNLVLKNTFGFS